MSNLAVRAVISVRNSKTKKIVSGYAVLSHMGDSAGVTAIMGLDSEQHRFDVAAPVVLPIWKYVLQDLWFLFINMNTS